MEQHVAIRPLRAGEFADPREAESDLDDFGPRPGVSDPERCSVDADGRLGVEAGGRLVGMVSWHWRDWGPNAGSRCPMIGIWLYAGSRGVGVGTQAQRLLVDLLFLHTTANRVEAHTDVDNVAEQRALERAGFTLEGVVRGAQWRSGRYRDGRLYSVLRAEWSDRWAASSR
ncbi:MAG TPA: GNAT family protein [Intrasporangium sp.]|uniref:GNAT family N-acetyltransferase n=1 Tax=Intrasporangium sp. TaxID=1925024 RepID=UPI002D7A3AAF|nr:GNAT family protein [Intrasporangium sp.]HET7399121.1 GNAT family protein [Intrasporangium sp.]